MAQFLALIPMTAGNFDSESATDGHVLTADGSGGAAWEEGGGGGGASFVFDGATFTPAEFVEDSGERSIEVEFTSGGNPITSGICFSWFFLTSDTNFNADTNTAPFDSYYNELTGAYSGSTSVDGAFKVYVVSKSDGSNCKFTFSAANSGVEPVSLYLNFTIPSGGVVSSADFSVPGIGE